MASGLHKVDSGASAASGQTQISWTNVDQIHVQALYGKCMKRYLTQIKIVHDRHKTAFFVYKGLSALIYIGILLNPLIYGVL